MKSFAKLTLLVLIVIGCCSRAARAQQSLFDQGQNVGIGTSTPDAALEIRADWFNPPAFATPEQKSAGSANLRLDGPAPSLLWHHEMAGKRIYALDQMGDGQLDGSLNFYLRRINEAGRGVGGRILPAGDSGWQRVLSLRDDLNVQIDHDLSYQGQQTKLDVSPQMTATVHCADFTIGHPTRRGAAPGRALVDWRDASGGDQALVINFADDWPITRIGGKATEVNTLTILGGADVAEPFDISGEEAPPEGSVVSIDPQSPGQLKRSSRAYDKCVAGVISGANGVNPGLALKQSNLQKDGRNVALTGRVYVLADASEEPIEPGDLLTTSSVPGHAMKAIDSARAQGAVLGKAMSRLSEGRGLVLVLVTLQ